MKSIKLKKECHLPQWSLVLLKHITFKDKHAKMISIRRVDLSLSRCWGQAGFQDYTEQILPLSKLGYWIMTDLWPARSFFSGPNISIYDPVAPKILFSCSSALKDLNLLLKILTFRIICDYCPHILMKTIISKQTKKQIKKQNKEVFGVLQ